MATSDDDIAFEDGQPILIGDDVRQMTDAIVDDPEATPVLVVAMKDDNLGVRVFGKPDEKVADLLDHIARTYRQAVQAARGAPQ